MSRATSIAEYLAEQPPDRRAALEALRKVIKKNLPKGFAESLHYGSIGYAVPLSRYPATYNGQPLAVAYEAGRVKTARTAARKRRARA